MQKVPFPDGRVFDGEAFRTPVVSLFLRDLERSGRDEDNLVARTGFEHGGAGEGVQCTDPGGTSSETGGWAEGELAARLVPTSNPLLAQLNSFEVLRAGVL